MLLRSSWKRDVHFTKIPHGTCTPPEGIQSMTFSWLPSLFLQNNANSLTIGFTRRNIYNEQIVSSKLSLHLPLMAQQLSTVVITGSILLLWSSNSLESQGSQLGVCSLYCFMVYRSFLCPSQSQIPAENFKFLRDCLFHSFFLTLLSPYRRCSLSLLRLCCLLFSSFFF